MKLELKKPSLLRPGPKTEGYLLSAMNLWNTPLSLWGLSQVTTAKDAEILDIGCGGGKTVSRLLKKAPEGHVYGMDSSFRAVDFSWRLNEEAIREGRCQIIEGSADSLPFDDNRFDLVLAEETFYFWKDPEACLKEVYRVLKPGGQFLLLHSKGAMPPDKIYEKLIPHMKVYSKKRIEGIPGRCRIPKRNVPVKAKRPDCDICEAPVRAGPGKKTVETFSLHSLWQADRNCCQCRRSWPCCLRCFQKKEINRYQTGGNQEILEFWDLYEFFYNSFNFY